MDPVSPDALGAPEFGPVDPLTLNTLGAVGIEFTAPCGAIEVRDGWMTIAALLVRDDGRVVVAPRVGAIGDGYRRRCIAAATRAWLEIAAGEQGWTSIPGVGRLGAVRVRYSPGVSSASGADSDSPNRLDNSEITPASVSGSTLS